MIHTTTRRRFLQTTAAVATTSLLATRPRRTLGANGKLNHAAIGVGGMGRNDLNTIASHGEVHIAAICDVDRNHLNNAKKRYPEARVYTDWRELLDKEGDRIDSVNVSVPDHMHAIIGLAAVRRGKHIYCQKPMCHDIAEVRSLTKAVADAGVVSQLGTQHASGIGDRMGVHFIRQGVIGRIKRVLLCSNRSGIDQYRPAGPRPSHADPVPDHLDWDLWIGTAPMRDYVNGLYHPGLWRGWLDFGTGWLGDIGCHIFDAPWKALDLTAPRTVVAEVEESWVKSPERRADTWPRGQHVTWIFPGNERTDGDLTVEWFDGMYYPDKEIRDLVMQTEPNYPEEAAFFVGTEGSMLLRHGGGPIFFPRDRFRDIERPRLPGQNHYHVFVDACLGKRETNSPFALSGPMTEAILLGTVALRVPGETLTWDAPAMRTNNDAANKFLRRTYRTGWEVQM